MSAVLGGAQRWLTSAVDVTLDRIVTQPFDVPTADDAVRLMSEPPPESVLLGRVTAPALTALLTRGTAWAQRVRAAGSATGAAGGPAGLGVTVMTAAGVAAVTRMLTSVRWGLRDVQVMASYLTTKTNAGGTALDRHLARTLTISAYLDPRRHPDLGYAHLRGARALVTAWTAQTVANRSEAALRTRAQQRVDALDRYDLPALTGEWERRP